MSSRVAVTPTLASPMAGIAPAYCICRDWLRVNALFGEPIRASPLTGPSKPDDFIEQGFQLGLGQGAVWEIAPFL
jgi:hypothetical protein